MLRRNPIVGSSMKKRLIYPNLMVREDARKAIRSNRILEIETRWRHQEESFLPLGDLKKVFSRLEIHW